MDFRHIALGAAAVALLGCGPAVCHDEKNHCFLTESGGGCQGNSKSLPMEPGDKTGSATCAKAGYTERDTSLGGYRKPKR
jgi:hypothetical protein